MLKDLALAAKAACSLEDQISLVPIIKQLAELGGKAQKKGLLGLESELSNINDPFLHLAIQLIVDETEAANLQDILDSDIYYNESNGRQLLKKIIIREGVLRIQSGDNARNILICTKIFLGKLDQQYWKNSG